MIAREHKKNIWIVEKPVGTTMGQIVDMFKTEQNIGAEIPVTFAGRLDPLVSGLVVLLVGPEVHNKEVWTKCEKEYRVEFLVGIGTDTYDVFGLPKIQALNSKSEILNKFEISNNQIQNIIKALEELQGTSFEYPYPAYSSKTVDGKPMWLTSRGGEEEIVAPMASFKINEIKNIQISKIDLSDVKQKVQFLCDNVPGDFRQSKILESWQGMQSSTLHTLRAEISVGSGTYIRSIANILYEKTGIPTCVCSLERTRIFREGIDIKIGS